MIERTRPDTEWSVADESGQVPTWERISIAVLMDIRRELRRLNAAIYCPNFMKIPHELTAIRKNTTKKKRKTP